jgi:hypothetical protein
MNPTLLAASLPQRSWHVRTDREFSARLSSSNHRVGRKTLPKRRPERPEHASLPLGTRPRIPRRRNRTPPSGDRDRRCRSSSGPVVACTGPADSPKPNRPLTNQPDQRSGRFLTARVGPAVPSTGLGGFERVNRDQPKPGLIDIYRVSSTTEPTLTKSEPEPGLGSTRAGQANGSPHTHPRKQLTFPGIGFQQWDSWPSAHCAFGAMRGGDP